MARAAVKNVITIASMKDVISVTTGQDIVQNASVQVIMSIKPLDAIRHIVKAAK